jgi:NitT/TauT family transport system ATP-binding protein
LKKPSQTNFYRDKKVLIDIKDLDYCFDDLQVLKNINLKIFEKEFLSIVGPSGCGKTTLLKIMAGLIDSKSGNVERNIFDIAYMPQKGALFEWKTLISNLALPLIVKGEEKKQAYQKARNFLEDFNLEKFENYYPSQLSGGMKQRGAFLRTMITGSELILLDEPFASVDEINRRKLQLWLIELLRRYSKTVVLVTHDIEEAILLSDRIVIMSDKPSKIIETINVDIPKPRSLESLTDPRFSTLEKKIYELLGSSF